MQDDGKEGITPTRYSRRDHPTNLRIQLREEWNRTMNTRRIECMGERHSIRAMDWHVLDAIAIIRKTRRRYPDTPD